MKKIIILSISVLYSLSSSAFTYEPFVLFGRPNLTFCFYERQMNLSSFELRSPKTAEAKYKVNVAEFSKSEKIFIRKILMESFSRESTGITFSKLLNCDLADILLVKNQLSPFRRRAGKNIKFGRASLGEAGLLELRGTGLFKKKYGFYRKSKYKAYVALSVVDRTTILHEFGHIAGLRHEHARPESYDDPGCKMENSPSRNGRSSLTEKIFNTTETIGEYDPKSIMNYCYINLNREKINTYQVSSLSNHDKEGLRELYSY